MIIQTTKEINGVMYAYSYSDSGHMIELDGVRYSEAVDPYWLQPGIHRNG